MLAAYFFLFLLPLGAWGRRILPPFPITLPVHILPRAESSTKASTSAASSAASGKIAAASATAGETSTDPQTATGITSVSISSDRQTYYALLKAGPINFRVSLDTGSSDLWITGSTCTTSTCTAVPRYPLGYSSPTFGVVNDNQTVFQATYADGTVASGFVARETVQVANLTLPDLAFGESSSCHQRS